VTGLRLAVVAVYAIGAFLVVLASRNAAGRERIFWLCAASALLALGIAKQLQLQDDLTGAARAALKAAGWDGQHERAQWLLALFVAIGALGLLVLLEFWLRGSASGAKAAATALTLLLGFVLVRAVSFHAVDRWVTHEALGMRLGWWVELLGVVLIGISALASLGSRKRSL